MQDRDSKPDYRVCKIPIEPEEDMQMSCQGKGSTSPLTWSCLMGRKYMSW